jgi:hypothetical protein
MQIDVGTGMGSGPSAGWARDIAGLEAMRIRIVKFGEVFAVDGAVGGEELVGDVGQDEGAAREDAAFGDELEEFVDVDTGVEFGGLG